MAFSIPQGLFDQYNEVCDYLLENDNFSRICTLIFPAKKVACADCIAFANGDSSNVYQHGGPATFSYNACVYCGGTGYKEEEVTDTIRLRIYWSRKDWVKINTIVIPQAEVQVIGKVSDLPQLLRANNIKLISEDKNLNSFFKLSCDPFLHGFGKTRYFVAFLQKV